MKTLATLISRAFEPMIVGSILAIAGAFHQGLVGQQAIRFSLFIAVVVFLPMAGVRFWFVKSQKLDWDIKDREKRILPLITLLIFLVLDVYLVSLWNNPYISRMFIVFLAWTVGYAAITSFWKISGHTSVITLASVMMFAWYGVRVWPIFLAIPLVTWARLVTKNHTLGQGIGGIVYSILLHEAWKSIL